MVVELFHSQNCDMSKTALGCHVIPDALAHLPFLGRNNCRTPHHPATVGPRDLCADEICSRNVEQISGGQANRRQRKSWQLLLSIIILRLFSRIISGFAVLTALASTRCQSFRPRMFNGLIPSRSINRRSESACIWQYVHAAWARTSNSIRSAGA
jgi:hypothetical protein